VPNSHQGRGWEHVTDATIRALDAKPERVVFVLWGAAAKAKARLVTGAWRAHMPKPSGRSRCRSANA
jgi:uracil DNA glycosylase